MSLAERAWQDVMASHSGTPLVWGPTDVDRFLGDPKRIVFFMSRYKFAAKMLARCGNIIDVGCGSGMGTATFMRDTVADFVLGVDFDGGLIAHANQHLAGRLNDPTLDYSARILFEKRDVMVDGLPPGHWRGISCIDVIEHIDPAQGDEFIKRLSAALGPHGVAVIGTPNKHAAQYGSVHSQIGHINMYEPDELRVALEKQFHCVFMFSMNDEVVHTGFAKLAHYLIAVAVK